MSEEKGWGPVIVACGVLVWVVWLAVLTLERWLAGDLAF